MEAMETIDYANVSITLNNAVYIPILLSIGSTMITKKPLLDVLFASAKRKSVLLLLEDGPKKMETILESLSTTRQALLPQIRILEDYHLVTGSGDTYELTTIGKLLVDDMARLVGVLEVFDIDIDYWGDRQLDFVPPHLLNRMHELGKCEIVNPPITDIYEFNTEFYERSKESGSVFRVSTFFHPMYSKLYPELMERGVKIYLVLSQDVLDRLRDKPDPDFEKLLENDLFNLFIYPKKAGLLTFASNDHYFLMRLLKNSGETDHVHLFCSSPSALEWGKELFEYYLRDSVPVTEI